MSDYSMPVLSEQEREIEIAACIEALKVLEKNLKTWGCVWKGYIESQIRRQKIALAALTAKPVAWGVNDTRCHTHEGAGYFPLYEIPPVPVIKQEGE